MSSLSTHARPSLAYSQPSNWLNRQEEENKYHARSSWWWRARERRDRSRMAWSSSKRARARTSRHKVIRQHSSYPIRLYSFICLANILSWSSHSKVLSCFGLFYRDTSFLMPFINLRNPYHHIQRSPKTCWWCSGNACRGNSRIHGKSQVQVLANIRILLPFAPPSLSFVEW
ncbi:hypothetical protein BC567DRAFT_2217 [Phyllosticta citribraziliensis]